MDYKREYRNQENSNRRKEEVPFILTSIFCLLTSIFCILHPTDADATTGIVNTKHNLSVTGPGEIKSFVETRICVFCHTPHNASPRTPLWNKEIRPVNYILYESSTLKATPGQPDGPSRLCLSCHDGTLALGAVLRPSEGISVTREITADRPAYIGASLMDDHPVSFSYFESAAANTEIKPVPPDDLLFYGNGAIHCSTCHDAHNDIYGKFLVTDNTGSALCIKCHQKDGWDQSLHKFSSQPLPTPLPGLEWTGWTTVAEYGCEGCHKPHTAGGPQRLLRQSKEEDNCYTCHNGTAASMDIRSQFLKSSRHRVEAATGIHKPKESPAFSTGHVECVDCHNSHAVTVSSTVAPFVSGKLKMASGVDISGAVVDPAAYEYEICFKCHADSASGFPFIQRSVNEKNTRIEFDRRNPSYHPVAGIGANFNVPSIPSIYEPTLTISSRIYCMDCHESDESSAIGGAGPRGPHGSIYAPLLRQRYETTMGTQENPENYALCYRCHNRDSILRDESFRHHKKHIADNNTPCSVCHDPHGVRAVPGTGDHTHLINFDSTRVSPITGQNFPLFNDSGTFSGNCTLMCHGKTHNNLSYP